MLRGSIRWCLDHLPYVGGLRARVRSAGCFPPGHYGSPIPSKDDIERHLSRRRRARDRGTEREEPLYSAPEISLDKQSQLVLLQELARFYPELPFPRQPRADCRYHFDQEVFGYSDAIVLYSFLRHFKPRRIVEIGSGFSTAVILDTLERFFGVWPQITSIEPEPTRLRQLLKPEDTPRVRVLEMTVQDAPSEVFAALGAGDLLFVDSSHVVKAGSDVHHLFFEIMPRLAQGVHVHFHDVFFPFDYPDSWLDEGRYWNECYFLRAYLAHNSVWKVTLFASYMSALYPEFFAREMPLCLENPGGSLYLQRL